MIGPIIAIIIACILDITLGDPPNRFHPVAAIGKAINFLANITGERYLLCNSCMDFY